MKPIETVAILGVGAMGALYLQHFQNSTAITAFAVAGGERAARLRREALRVNGERVSFEVFDAQQHASSATDKAQARAEQTAVDLVIVAVKQHHLLQALEQVRPLVGPDTVFLSVLNGLDSEPLIANAFSAEQVLYCIALGMDANRVGATVTYGSAGRLVFGDARNDEPTPRVRRVQAALDHAGLAWETPADMMQAMWWKFMVNVGVNQASALCRAPYAVMQRSQPARDLMRALIDEVLTLSSLEGVPLGEADVERWYAVLDGLSPVGKTSMLQDVEAGRPSEVDIFAGKVVRLGRAHGVATPFNQAAQYALSALSDGQTAP